MAHFVCDVEVGPEGGCGEEACDDSVEAGGDSGALAGEIHSYDAEVLAQLSEVPAVTAEDADFHSRLHQRVGLAVDGENECGFAAAIGAEDGDVLAGFDGEIDVVEDDALAAGYVDIFEFEKIDLRCSGYALRHGVLIC